MLFITSSVYYISVTKMFEQNLKKIVLITLTYDKIVKKKILFEKFKSWSERVRGKHFCNNIISTTASYNFEGV